MAVIEQGIVQSVTSLSAGTILTDAGSLVNYSDGSLPIRNIFLNLGDRVIFSLNITASDINVLDGVNSQAIADSNANNQITAASINKNLQIYNCCSAKKGVKYIDGLIKGENCIGDLAQAQLMTNLIDSVCGIIPQYEIIGGNQATYMIILEVLVGIAPRTATITIGSATYVITTSSATTTLVAADIAAYINTFYPHNYPYFAFSSGADIVISGSNFDSDNGTAVTYSSATILANVLSPNQLDGGTAQIIQGQNNITNNQIQGVLDKLCNLCSKPCKEIVNFA